MREHKNHIHIPILVHQ